MNNMGLSASPCGVSMFELNGRDFIRSSFTSRFECERSLSVISHSSSPYRSRVCCISLFRSMVSNALVMSMHKMLISILCLLAVPVSHL